MLSSLPNTSVFFPECLLFVWSTLTWWTCTGNAYNNPPALTKGAAGTPLPCLGSSSVLTCTAWKSTTWDLREALRCGKRRSCHSRKAEDRLQEEGQHYASWGRTKKNTPSTPRLTTARLCLGRNDPLWSHPKYKSIWLGQSLWLIAPHTWLSALGHAHTPSLARWGNKVSVRFRWTSSFHPTMTVDSRLPWNSPISETDNHLGYN